MLMYDSMKTLVFRKSNLQQNEDIYENPLSSSIFNQDNLPRLLWLVTSDLYELNLSFSPPKTYRKPDTSILS